MAAIEPDAIELAEYHPWRRVVFFLIGFAVCAAAALAYFYTRPAEYSAVSQLRIIPAGTLMTSDSGSAALPRDDLVAFLTEVRVLTSQAVLQESVARLKNIGGLPDLGLNPVTAVQHLLRARPLAQTQVVELSAEGPDRRFLTRLLTTVAESWRDHATRLYQQQISGEYRDLKKQADDLHNATLAARARLDQFRETNGIPPAGVENALAADLQNLNSSYTAALATMAKAQVHLRTLQNAGDTAADASQNDPAVVALEQKAATLRDQLSNLQRRFTPQYLALDVDTRSLPEQVAELDKQIVAQRNADRAATRAAELRATEEQLETCQLQFNRLSRDVSEKQNKLREISARRIEYDTLQGELDRAQKLEQSMMGRMANLQATQRERAPRLDILQAAQFSAAPDTPIPTIYAAISLAASLAAGVLAALFSKLLDGAPAVAWTTASRRRHMKALIGYGADPLNRLLDTAPRKLLPAPDRE